MTVESTTFLGPYSRYALWVQGCMRMCPGCISKDSQPLDGGYEAETQVLADGIIRVPDIEGITISGGEPFLQSEALVDLIGRIKRERDLGIILYTGFEFDEIKENELTKLCDMIIDGAYVEDLNDGLSLRGSSNQKIQLITNRYEEEAKSLYGVQGRKIELRFTGDKAMMVGVPDKKYIQLFEVK